MDDFIVSQMPDLTDVTVADLQNPTPELREILDAVTERFVRQLDRPTGDGRCC